MVSEPTIMDPVANNSSPLSLLNNMSNLMSIKLDSVNYMIWKLQLSAILDAYLMIEHLDAMVVGSTTSQEVWNRLEEKFTYIARANVFNLKLELQGIKKGNESINSYLQRIKSTRDKLSTVGVLVDNEELLHMVLKRLPKEFAPFAFVIRTRDDTISFEKLSVLLQTEEQSMSEASDPFPNSALVMFVSNNQKPHTGFNGGFTGSQGYNRGRGGRNSSNRGRGGSPQGRSERPTCQIYWKIGHYAIDCYHRMDFAYQGKNLPTKLATMASASNLQHVQGSETWLTDTGATDHITSNASNLNTPTPYHDSEQVTVGNGQNLPIQSIVHKLCLDNNCSCHFDTKQLLIQDLPTGRLLYKGLSKDGVYPIQSSQFCSSTSHKSAYLASSSALKWQLWHSRLGYPSAKSKPVTSVPISVSCHDSRFIAPTPNTIILSTHPSESTLLPNEPSTITSDTSLTTSQHPMQARSKNDIYKPKLGYAVQIDYTLTEPSSYKAAAQHPQWCTAMQDEFDALQKQGTWSLVTPPPNKNVVGCKWVYKLKHNSDGTIARYKARLVAKGFHQQQGVDFDETFSPVIKPPTAPRAWFESFTTQLLHLGFIASTADSSLFIYHHQQVIAYLLLYVDDIVLTSNSLSFLDHLILQLKKVFDLKDLGALHYFLGIQVSQTSDALHVTQSKYASDLLIKYHMVDSKPTKTPCSPNIRLSLHEGDLLSDPHGYRSLVEALHYLTFTRPDISFAIHQVCQYMAAPTSTHLTAAKRVLRYIKGTLYHGIAFTPGPLSLSVFSDADWAGDLDDRRSTSGLLVYLGSNPITWSAKKQPTVSRSSTESKYQALVTAFAEVCWIRTLLKDLGIYLSQPPILWCDNVSALAIASNPVFHARTKHIEVDFHFI
uniref:Reverse transcriptase Ty1/copia-type domain-containing protein n=1 Tax=Fagus sylvatica TaxID=28930 RepID=A0A2N9IWR1_FAGSY